MGEHWRHVPPNTQSHTNTHAHSVIHPLLISACMCHGQYTAVPWYTQRVYIVHYIVIGSFKFEYRKVYRPSSKSSSSYRYTVAGA